LPPPPTGAELLEKRPRNADRDDEGPKINDILSGLLSVVGEGLSFATNYVQEQNKRKQQQTQQLTEQEEQDKLQDLLQQLEAEQPDSFQKLPGGGPDQLFPSRNRTRVNNRGPPKLSGIPFEAIPLEVLNNKLPNSALIPQRPFKNRFPPGRPVKPPGQQLQPPPPPPPKKPPLTIKGPPSDKLFPNREKPELESSTTGSPLPTRPGYEPGFLPPPSGTSTSKVNLTTEDITDTTVDQLAAEIAIIENLLKGGGGNTGVVDTTTENTKITEDGEGETVPDRNNLLQNDLSRPRPPPTPQSRPSTSTSTQPLIEPSFPPPILVTPPPERKRKPYDRRRPPPRPNGRPPLRQPTRQKPQGPYSAVPTPALPGRPLVFPTRPRQTGIVTGVAIPAENEVFDLTVTAQQNFGGKPTIKRVNNFGDIITKPQPGDDYVSIDGKRTYFDIGPGRTRTSTAPKTRTVPPAVVPQVKVQPTKSSAGKGSVIGATLKIGGDDILNRYEATSFPVSATLGASKKTQASSLRPQTLPVTVAGKPGPTRRPQAPPVRIDTCIVGDNNTCRTEHDEVCLTVVGVSSCYCKPG